MQTHQMPWSTVGAPRIVENDLSSELDLVLLSLYTDVRFIGTVLGAADENATHAVLA
jgi:hypothetical protein